MPTLPTFATAGRAGTLPSNGDPGGRGHATSITRSQGANGRHRRAGKRDRQPETSEPRMALNKSELYSSLWSSCDELRGGMDASQYKD
jgi:hypothetical protein